MDSDNPESLDSDSEDSLQERVVPQSLHPATYKRVYQTGPKHSRKASVRLPQQKKTIYQEAQKAMQALRNHPNKEPLC